MPEWGTASPQADRAKANRGALEARKAYADAQREARRKKWTVSLKKSNVALKEAKVPSSGPVSSPAMEKFDGEQNKVEPEVQSPATKDRKPLNDSTIHPLDAEETRSPSLRAGDSIVNETLQQTLSFREHTKEINKTESSLHQERMKKLAKQQAQQKQRELEAQQEARRKDQEEEASEVAELAALRAQLGLKKEGFVGRATRLWKTKKEGPLWFVPDSKAPWRRRKPNSAPEGGDGTPELTVAELKAAEKELWMRIERRRLREKRRRSEESSNESQGTTGGGEGQEGRSGASGPEREGDREQRRGSGDQGAEPPPPPPVPNTFGLPLGSTLSPKFTAFHSCFEPFCARGPSGDALRAEAFQNAASSTSATPPGSCSFAELEGGFVLRALLKAYPRADSSTSTSTSSRSNSSGGELGSKTPGKDVFAAFKPCFPWAFNLARGGALPVGAKQGNGEDAVTEKEFFLFCVYLVVFAAMLDAFTKLVGEGGDGSGSSSSRKQQLSVEEFVSGLGAVRGHGFVALEEFQGMAAKGRAEAEGQAARVFARHSTVGGELMEAGEWCEWLQRAEVDQGTEVGKLLAMGPAQAAAAASKEEEGGGGAASPMESSTLGAETTEVDGPGGSSTEHGMSGANGSEEMKARAGEEKDQEPPSTPLEAAPSAAGDAGEQPAATATAADTANPSDAGAGDEAPASDGVGGGGQEALSKAEKREYKQLKGKKDTGETMDDGEKQRYQQLKEKIKASKATNSSSGGGGGGGEGGGSPEGGGMSKEEKKEYKSLKAKKESDSLTKPEKKRYNALKAKARLETRTSLEDNGTPL